MVTLSSAWVPAARVMILFIPVWPVTSIVIVPLFARLSALICDVESIVSVLSPPTVRIASSTLRLM